MVGAIRSLMSVVLSVIGWDGGEDSQSHYIGIVTNSSIIHCEVDFAGNLQYHTSLTISDRIDVASKKSPSRVVRLLWWFWKVPFGCLLLWKNCHCVDSKRILVFAGSSTTKPQHREMLSFNCLCSGGGSSFHHSHDNYMRSCADSQSRPSFLGNEPVSGKHSDLAFDSRPSHDCHLRL